MKLQKKSASTLTANLLMVLYLISMLWQKGIYEWNVLKNINTLQGCEFLINYQGGYVRRGLLGEILFWLCRGTMWDPRIVIGAISLVSFSILTLFLVRQFRKSQLCWWLLPLNFTLLGADIVRKDALCMLIVIGIVYVVKGAKSPWGRIAAIYLLNLVLCNLHEAFFLVIGPLSMLFIFCNKESRLRPFARLLLTLPLPVFFGLPCLCNGNREIANDIYLSWCGLFPSLGWMPMDDTGLNALYWDTGRTFVNHFLHNYGIYPHTESLALFLRPLLFVLIYYIVTRFVFLFNRDQQVWSPEARPVFSALMIFQFAALTPMFTVLSTDWSRTLMYWTVSSLSVFFILGPERLRAFFPIWLLRLAASVDQRLDRWFPPTKALVFLLLIFTGVSRWGMHNIPIWDRTVAGEAAHLLSTWVFHLFGLATT